MKIAKKKKTLVQVSAQQHKRYTAFWKWFSKYQKRFYKILKAGNGEEIDSKFLDPLMEKLAEIREGYFVLTGLADTTAELIITADGDIKTIAFVEDLVAQAPVIPDWKFYASKPEANDGSTTIDIYGFSFTVENQYFYPREEPANPDNICITVVNPDFTEAHKGEIAAGVFLFLDNLLGEVKSVTNIDSVRVTSPAEAEHELIPIEKLKGYLAWREKEFVEKYENVYYDTANDSYVMLNATTAAGNPVMIAVNSGPMEWNESAAHPWLLKINIKYNSDRKDGLPEPDTNPILYDIEDIFLEELPLNEGYIWLGRETYDGNRFLYMACRDFRQPSRVAEYVADQYSQGFTIEWEIYKDKYWVSLESFRAKNWIVREEDEEEEEE